MNDDWLPSIIQLVIYSIVILAWAWDKYDDYKWRKRK